MRPLHVLAAAITRALDALPRHDLDRLRRDAHTDLTTYSTTAAADRTRDGRTPNTNPKQES